MTRSLSRNRDHQIDLGNPQWALINLQTQIYCETRYANRPIPQLMTSLLDRRNLEAAWGRVQSADGANTPGVDGVMCNDVQGQAASWLARLGDDLYHRRYKPLAPRWVEVPKQNNPAALRRLGILTIRDRVVHTAIKQVLEPILEPIFWSCSFGFRPGRSVPGALAEALRLLTPRADDIPPFTVGVHVDVAKCFDTIDHEVLLEELKKHVADPELLALVQQILLPGGVMVRRFFFRQRVQGLVQGSALSPLLCNLYLDPLDQGISELERESENTIRALRYADDLLLLARDNRSASRAVACVSKLLAGLCQQLRDPNAALRPIHEGVDWLGVRLQARSHRWAKQISFGYFIPDAKVEGMLTRLTEMTTPPSEKISSSAFNPEGWIVSLNEQLRDWHQAYRFADNALEVFRALDQHTRDRLGSLLQNLTGARRHEVFQRYRLQLPRGFWTWQVNGVRLAVISFLAPRCPAHLTRRPAWMRQPRKPAGDVGVCGLNRVPSLSKGTPALASSTEKENL